MTTKTRAEVTAQIDVLTAALTEYCNARNICAHIYTYEFEVEFGSKNARIVRGERWPNQDGLQSRSVHCFVRLEDGAILKGSWKAPVKNPVRGNIFKEGCDIGDGRALGLHGCNYLR